MAGVTFNELHRAMSRAAGPTRMEAFYTQDEAEQKVAWDHLAGDSADRHFLNGHLPFQSRKPKPVKRDQLYEASKVTTIVASFDPPRSERAARDWERGTEALNSIPAETYLEILVPDSEPSRGKCRCPWPNDHEDNNPSATYNETVFNCFPCGKGGGIFQLGSALTGLADRGDQFIELRRWLIEQMLGVNA